MSINLFGNSSHDNNNKIDTSLFVQKPYLRTNLIDNNIEDIETKNQLRIKNLPDPKSIREAASKKYVNNKFNGPSILKNTTLADINKKNLDNVHSIKAISLPTLEDHLIPKFYVDNAISYSVNESSLLRLDPKEKLKLDERS